MKKDNVWITGNGMVGKALEKALSKNKKYNVIITPRKILDQTDQKKQTLGLEKINLK